MEKWQFVNDMQKALGPKESIRFETLLNALKPNNDYFWEKIEILLGPIEENPSVGICLYGDESDALDIIELIWLLDGVFWWVSDEVDDTNLFNDTDQFDASSVIYACVLHKIKES